MLLGKRYTALQNWSCESRIVFCFEGYMRGAIEVRQGLGHDLRQLQQTGDERGGRCLLLKADKDLQAVRASVLLHGFAEHTNRRFSIASLEIVPLSQLKLEVVGYLRGEGPLLDGLIQRRQGVSPRLGRCLFESCNDFCRHGLHGQGSLDDCPSRSVPSSESTCTPNHGTRRLQFRRGQYYGAAVGRERGTPILQLDFQDSPFLEQQLHGACLIAAVFERAGVAFDGGLPLVGATSQAQDLFFDSWRWDEFEGARQVLESKCSIALALLCELGGFQQNGLLLCQIGGCRKANFHEFQRALPFIGGLVSAAQCLGSLQLHARLFEKGEQALPSGLMDRAQFQRLPVAGHGKRGFLLVQPEHITQ